MTFIAFQAWRLQCLNEQPEPLDCAETNLYRSLAWLQPLRNRSTMDQPVHRCDLARAWLRHFGFPEGWSRRALVSKGIRHALSLIFEAMARNNAVLWTPSDVYPVYQQLAKAVGIVPRVFQTLPEPRLHSERNPGRAEYLLVTNPWKPLGRFLQERECATLVHWLQQSAQRILLLDCVYDLGRPFHATTLRLLETGRSILLHSVTKGWLWPKTFGVALMPMDFRQLDSAFLNDPPSQQDLLLAGQLLSHDAHLPDRILTTLTTHKQKLLTVLPPAVRQSLLLDPCEQSAGCYFFPTRIRANELFERHRIIAVPASAFGARWEGSILSSLGSKFNAVTNGGAE